MKTFKQMALATTATLAMTAAPVATASDIQTVLTGSFESLQNATPGGYYKGARRGTLSGGSYWQRNRVVGAPNLVNFRAPSLDASCSGIDADFGSFSHISSDQLEQFGRAVLSNAVGYAWKIALDAACESCSSAIEWLEANAKKLNGMLKDSCNTAQMLVGTDIIGGAINGVTGGLGKASANMFDQSLGRLMESAGLNDDAGDSSENANFEEARGSANTAVQGEIAKLENANPLGAGLTSGNLASRFAAITGALTDFEEFQGTLLAMTGMVITGQTVREQDATGANTNGEAMTKRTLPPLISLREMVEGGQLDVYRCSDDAKGDQSCVITADSRDTITIVGAREQIQDLFLDTGTGIVDRLNLSATASVDLNDNQNAVMELMDPLLMASMMRIARQGGENALESPIRQASRAIALGIAYELMDSAFKVVETQSTASADMPIHTEALAVLKQNREQLYRDFLALTTEYGTVRDSIEYFRHAEQLANQTQATIASR